jgi:hypothetical protein
MPRRILFFVLFSVISTLAFQIYRPLNARPQNEKRAEKFRHGDATPDRLFDPENRDYHLWDQNEEAAYRRYWDEQHRAFRPFAKLNARQQCRYWAWRHKHPGPETQPNG